MEIIGKGNANILIRFPNENDDKNDEYLYRFCIRPFQSLESYNSYTMTNHEFIKRELVPLLGEEYVCSLELVSLPICDDLKRILGPYCKSFITKNMIPASDSIMGLKVLNLKPSRLSMDILQEDHQLKVYVDATGDKIVLEVKPKWLYNPDTLGFCRNCVHNSFKKRENIKYCMASMVKARTHHQVNIMDLFHENTVKCLPEIFIDDLNNYFQNDDNVLKRLYYLQRNLSDKTVSIEKINSDDDVTTGLMILMILRDVTVFISWDKQDGDTDGNHISSHIIDLDLKPRSKWKHWQETERLLSKQSNNNNNNNCILHSNV
ncbi:inositol pentakisphosphate 2-kinase NDAI_0C04280 [Naumovozyma dairenensis CBS 421]|uniref:Inositol-pentakisphosphate 2-kinase n=1 Tax=Naumovozyma dairenensis (strain ATCC 10597 / BCRC 20456 / CBS 421 / NBRC 0211 / NRRL Y-12639) TaxID=1071378 RepID=G0W8H7_NAUDC|nr:hypothetical protein NDAI_0C04280 [Naumovozyma dairenensis CBS 421]CCD24088.1 hypothetical protein NDAI_0C04280 [Naumovozyma dairenensis CBS 421]